MGIGVDILCEASGLVWLLPGGKDLQTVATCAKAVKGAGTCEGPSVTAVHLGWTTELEQMAVGPEWLDEITDGTNGEPGWLVECTIPLIGRINDECVTDNGTVILTNEANGTVAAEFPEPANEEQADCTEGGKLEGLVVGKFIIEALTPAGAKIPLAASLD
jgi:hypothetical protein